MEENIKDEEVIDLRKVVRKVWQRKKLFKRVLPIVFVVSALIIFPVPRYYECSVMLAPELERSMSGSSLTTLASSFGVNLSSSATGDALSPMLYPDLMGSTDFLISLFPVEVTTEDGELTADYYTYLCKHQKVSIWSMPFKWVLKQVRKLASLLSGEKKYEGDGKVNAFRLTKEQKEITEKISDNMQCSLDKKTDVLTITVRDQDPLVCATMADTVSLRLQHFITAYKTNKARIDQEYYEGLVAKAKKEYDEAMDMYGRQADANMNVVMERYKLQQTELENEMQLKFNTYSALNNELQSARARVQERTPAFTMLQCATVPIKPAGPKRLIFIAAMLFLSCVAVVAYILKDDFINQLKR